MRTHIALCGHIHVPALYHMSQTGKVASFEPVGGIGTLSRHRRWLAVLGAVGQPRDGNSAACYAILDDVRETLSYMRVPYDIDGAAQKSAPPGSRHGLPIDCTQDAEGTDRAMATFVGDQAPASTTVRDVRHLRAGETVDGFRLEMPLPPGGMQASGA